ncbi:alpha/beta fold hydrolase [Ectobacillus sp. sgz5001026]|uniref:alpha/beta fold hydrolase n=1 Tax=Ectobacillus sp. sgz5001026 TaxID=3242473 RepID=UPI0036D401B8
MPMLEVDGCSLYYSVQGSGIPIVFIHPPVLTSINFTYQIEELSKSFKVITFDMRGHGRSQFSHEPITYPLIAQDICCILDHLQIEQAFLCGYSTGGSIVLEFLQVFASQALGGIVISGMSEVNDAHLNNKIMLGMRLAKAGAVSILAWSVSWSNSNTRKLFVKMFKAARRGNAENVEQYYQYSLHYNCTNQLADIKQPILVVYGKMDKIFSYYAKRMHEKLPHSDLLGIDHVKHQVPTKAAKYLNQSIKGFIERSHL